MLSTEEFVVRNPYRSSKEEFHLSCAPNDEFVAGWMRKGWLFEPFNLHVLSEILDPQSVILDVGAHIGTFSVVLGKLLPQSRIHAFEPQVPLYSILLKNLEKNGVENCQPFNLAVAHRQTLSAVQRAVRDGNGAGKAVAYGDPGRYNFAGLSLGLGEHVVACIRLDEFVAKAGLPRVDLIKIDVEGAEPFVLYGARKILSEHRPILHFEENDKRVTPELARGLGCSVTHAAARFSVRYRLKDDGYLYLRMPFDNVMLAPSEALSPQILELFEKQPSDSRYFQDMYVFRQDEFSRGYRPESKPVPSRRKR